MAHIVIIFGTIAALAILILLIQLFRRRQKTTISSQCTVESAWNRYVGNPGKWTPRDRTAIEKLAGMTEADQARLEASRVAAVEKALATPEPLAALRLAIMDATDRFVIAETLCSTGTEGGTAGTTESSTRSDALDGVLEAGFLRCYAMLRSDDYAREDWYSYYLNIAERNSANVAAMVRKTVAGESSSLETALHDPLTRTMQQVRQHLLRHPPRTRVNRIDKLVDKDPTLQSSPSQAQIDRLNELMTDRFEKLFSGQIYHIESGPAATPAEVFQIDAGLLYTVLATRFRHPGKAWREIMETALGPYREAMQNEEEILEKAREMSRIWVEDNDGAALNAVLRAACDRVFESAAATGSASSEGCMSILLEDAAPLVGAIREALST